MPERDGVLTIANGRLRFLPETYPVAHLANEGWRKEPDGTWTAQLTLAHASVVQRWFPHVMTTTTFIAWLEEGVQQAIQSPFTPKHPEKWGALFPYQKRAAEWLAGRRSALLSLAPGQGKSCVALAAAQMACRRRVLVVCPLTLLSTWKEQTQRWWPGTPCITTDSPGLFADTDHAPLVATMTYDALWRAAMLREQRMVNSEARIFYVPNKTALREWQGTFDLAILDESVLIKNREAIRARAAALLRQVVSHCWLLSGSPTTRFLDDLWMQLHTLDPKTYRSYWRFTNACTLTRNTIWGRQVVANVPGAEATLKQTTSILYTYNYADLARDEPERTIPEWVFEARKVPLPVAWWKLYKQMQDKFMADLPDGNRVLAPNVLARMVRLLQLASHPALLMLEPVVSPLQDSEEDGAPFYAWSAKGGKLSAIPGLLEELPGPTIIWTNFIATAKHLAQTLKAPLLIGETPTDERTKIVTAFQAGEHPVLIAHPGVGRFGLTLTKARSAIYAERSYDGDAWVQSLSRIRRIGTTEPPQVVILEATGPNGEATIDRLISLTLRYRKERSEVLTTQQVREALQ